MTNDRLLEIAIMEMNQLQKDLDAVNANIDAAPADSDGVPVQSPAFSHMVNEQTAIEDRIDRIKSSLTQGVRDSASASSEPVIPFSSPCSMVVEGA